MVSNNYFTGAVVAARMSSRRLPGKVLTDLSGKPVLQRVIDRVKLCAHVNKIVLATSTDMSDDKIYDYCMNSNIECFRGNLDNVLKRYLDVIQKYNFDLVVRVLCDSPFVDPAYIDLQIEGIKKYKADLCINKCPTSLFFGAGAFSVKLLKDAWEKTKHLGDYEHVGGYYIKDNIDILRIVGINIPDYLCRTDIRITLDEVSDLKVAIRLQEYLDNLLRPYEMSDIVRWFDKQISIENKKTQFSEETQKSINWEYEIYKKIKYVGTVSLNLDTKI